MNIDLWIDFICSYHLAEKKIPSIHGYTMGLKLEQFIFDAFPYAPTTALFEVNIILNWIKYLFGPPNLDQVCFRSLKF